MPRYNKDRPKPQDVKFVKEFVKHGNGSEAAFEAYPVNKKSSYAVAHRKLKTPAIKQMVNEEMKRQGLTPSYVLGSRKAIVDKGLKDLPKTKVTPSDINKSLYAFERLLGMYEEGRKSPTAQHLHLHQAPRSKVLDARRKLVEWFDGIEA